jgi:hypothetical protein
MTFSGGIVRRYYLDSGDPQVLVRLKTLFSAFESL